MNPFANCGSVDANAIGRPFSFRTTRQSRESEDPISWDRNRSSCRSPPARAFPTSLGDERVCSTALSM